MSIVVTLEGSDLTTPTLKTQQNLKNSSQISGSSSHFLVWRCIDRMSTNRTTLLVSPSVPHPLHIDANGRRHSTIQALPLNLD